MRISTSYYYQVNVSTMNQQQSSLLHFQQQLSTGQRVLTPSDDPVAAARALEVSQASSQNDQYATNQGAASDSLTMLESKMQGISDLLQYVKDRAIQANSSALSQADRNAIATDVQAQLDNLKGLANSTDASGEYLFSGYKGNTMPFVAGGSTSGGIQYAGDQGQRTLEVAQGRQLPVSDNGQELFMHVDDGSGGFTDMFSMMKDFINNLQTGTGSAYNTGVEASIGQVTNALDNVLRMQSRVGSRQIELQGLQGLNADLKLQYADQSNRLTGLDYASAISDLQQQQTYLEASRATFAKVSGLTLFNYLSN